MTTQNILKENRWMYHYRLYDSFLYQFLIDPINPAVEGKGRLAFSLRLTLVTLAALAVIPLLEAAAKIL